MMQSTAPHPTMSWEFAFTSERNKPVIVWYSATHESQTLTKVPCSTCGHKSNSLFIFQVRSRLCPPCYNFFTLIQKTRIEYIHILEQAYNTQRKNKEETGHNFIPILPIKENPNKEVQANEQKYLGESEFTLQTE